MDTKGRSSSYYRRLQRDERQSTEDSFQRAYQQYQWYCEEHGILKQQASYTLSYYKRRLYHLVNVNGEIATVRIHGNKIDIDIDEFPGGQEIIIK